MSQRNVCIPMLKDSNSLTVLSLSLLFTVSSRQVNVTKMQKKVAIFMVTRVYELFLQLFRVKALHSYLANPPQELFLLWSRR